MAEKAVALNDERPLSELSMGEQLSKAATESLQRVYEILTQGFEPDDWREDFRKFVIIYTYAAFAV
jgi:hypothetical protein